MTLEILIYTKETLLENTDPLIRLQRLRSNLLNEVYESSFREPNTLLIDTFGSDLLPELDWYQGVIDACRYADSKMADSITDMISKLEEEEANSWDNYQNSVFDGTN